MKTLLLSMCILLCLTSAGQDNNKELQTIVTISDADAFIKTHPGAEMMYLNTGTSNSGTAKKIFASAPGDLLIVDDHTYKVIEVKPSTLLRVYYIFLDGTRLVMDRIDSLRKVIIEKYNSGTAFSELVKEYGMDGNPTGDIGWAPEEMLVKEFSSAVKAHNKGDLFTIDAPEKKWYYVVLKAFDDRGEKSYSVLRVKNSYELRPDLAGNLYICRIHGISTKDDPSHIKDNNCDQEQNAERISLSGKQEEKLIVYPNPSVESLTLVNLPLQSTINLYDNNGRKTYSVVSTTTKTSIQTKELGNGVYLLEVIKDDFRLTKKILVSNP